MSNSQDPKDYEKDFSSQSFFAKLASQAVKAGKDLVENALILYYVLEDSDTPMWARTAIIGALGYFISPIDFIPDLTPLLGYTDDASVIAAALVTVTQYIKPEHKAKAKATVKKYLG